VACLPLVVLADVEQMMVGPRLAGIDSIHAFILLREEDDRGP
jgi:hypothetical protein